MSMQPAGWYRDPSEPGVLRWWDGSGWSEHRALPAPAARQRPEFERLPLRVAIGALLAMAIPLIASRWVLRGMLDWDLPIALYIVVLAAVVYGPPLWWWRLATRRQGKGSPVQAIALRFRAVDAGWGPVTWAACLGGQIVAAAVILAFDIPLEGNTESLRESRTVMAYVIPMVVLTVVIAPFVEEIVFRGLVLRGLAGSMPVWGAVVTQGVLFGVAHVDPGRGSGNVGLVIVLSVVGAVLGGAAFLFRRLGPSIIAHAIINTIATAVALSGWEAPTR